MSVAENDLRQVERPSLDAFELPMAWVRPAVRACRLFNTVLDAIFYDTPGLSAALAAREAPTIAAGKEPPSRIVDFDDA